MAKTKSTKDDKRLATELSKHENEWVAMVCKSGSETVVGSGKRIGDARKDAESKGYKNATYMKVPSSDKAFIATFF